MKRFTAYNDDDFEVVGIDKKPGSWTDYIIDMTSETRMAYLRSLYQSGFSYIVHCTSEDNPKVSQKLNVDVLYSFEDYLISENTEMLLLVIEQPDKVSAKFSESMALTKAYSDCLNVKMNWWDGRCDILDLEHVDPADEKMVEDIVNCVEAMLSVDIK